jgi:hypothetical protein
MTSKWHGGKGSDPRPVDTDAYSKNWERIFNNGKGSEKKKLNKKV